jgi:L-lactate dehydrogenase complex protein LldG
VTPEERARMRSTLRQALGRALLPDAGLTHPGSMDSLMTSDIGHRASAIGPDAAHTDAGAPSTRGLVNRFRTELAALGGDVHEAEGEAQVLEIIHRLVGRDASPKVLMWEDEALPVRGVRDALAAAGIAVTTQTPSDMRSVESKTELARCTVGITGAEAGLADTGSIVVVSGPGRGRLASLLPPVHIALLRREAMTTSLPVLVATRPELITGGSNFVCITGPCRSSPSRSCG